MPFNGSGSFSPPGADFPAVANTLIEATKFNAIINDIATGLSTCLTTDGQSVVTSNITLSGYTLLNAGLRSIDGSVGAPGISFNNDTDCGLYRIGTNNLGLTISGTKLLDLSAAAVGITGSLGVSGAVSLTGDVTAGAAAGAPVYSAKDTASFLTLAAVPAAPSSSAWVKLYGSTHATKSGQLEYNTGGASHVFKVSDVTVASISSAGLGTFEKALIANNSTAIPAGGDNTAGVKFSSTANFGVFFGSGAPTLSAGKGSLYLRTDGTGTTTRAYSNTDGGTSWTSITTAG